MGNTLVCDRQRSGKEFTGRTKLDQWLLAMQYFILLFTAQH